AFLGEFRVVDGAARALFIGVDLAAPALHGDASAGDGAGSVLCVEREQGDGENKRGNAEQAHNGSFHRRYHRPQFIVDARRELRVFRRSVRYESNTSHSHCYNDGGCARGRAALKAPRQGVSHMENPTRRTFLAAATAAVGPYLIGADVKSGTKNPVIKAGDH